MPGKHVDPIPETFANLDDAGAFWDSHDTMDYTEELQAVDNPVLELRHRYLEVEIDMSVAEVLREKARERGVSVTKLVNEMLRKQLTAA